MTDEETKKTNLRWVAVFLILSLVGGVKGQGVPQDDAEAFKWYKLAAEQGRADAQMTLGLMYATGKGVPEDFVYAYVWMNLAASNGESTFKEYRDTIKSSLSPSQLERPLRLSTECFKKNYKDCYLNPSKPMQLHTIRC